MSLKACESKTKVSSPKAKKMFTNKVVIVTGSSSGIGKETAKIFAREGANVVLHGQNLERLEQAVKEIEQIPKAGKVIGVIGPIQKEETWKKIVQETLNAFDKIDVLVNNAGTRDDGKDPHGIDCFTYCMDVNVKSVIGLTRACLPHLKKTKGNIVNVTSALEDKINPMAPMYAISKAALKHYTHHAAFEYAPVGIRVNNVSPGLTDTFFHQRHISNNPEHVKAVTQLIPLKRMGRPEEVGEMIVFVASDKCSYVTGETFGVNGGLKIKP